MTKYTVSLGTNAVNEAKLALAVTLVFRQRKETTHDD